MPGHFGRQAGAGGSTGWLGGWSPGWARANLAGWLELEQARARAFPGCMVSLTLAEEKIKLFLYFITEEEKNNNNNPVSQIEKKKLMSQERKCSFKYLSSQTVPISVNTFLQPFPPSLLHLLPREGVGRAEGTSGSFSYSSMLPRG